MGKVTEFKPELGTQSGPYQIGAWNKSDGIEVKTSINALYDTVAGLGTDPEVTQAIEDLEEGVSGLNTSVSEIQSDVSALQIEVSSNSDLIGGLGADLESVDTSISSIQAKNTSQDTAISILQGKDTSHDAAISALQSKDTSLDTDISGLRSKDTSLDADISGLRSKDSTIDTSITALQGKDTAHDTAISNLQTKDVSHDNAISALQGKDTIHDSAITAIQTKNTDQDTAIASKVPIVAGKVDPNYLDLVVYDDYSFSGVGDASNPFSAIDPLVAAFQYLGSPIKAFTVGVNPFLITGTAGTLVSGNYVLNMVKLPRSYTLSGVAWMLATSGVGVTSTNENRIGLFTYNKAGVLTLVASTINRADLYTQTAGNVLQEPFWDTAGGIAKPYTAAGGYYWVGWIYSASAATTAPALVSVSFGLANKVNMLTTNGAKVHAKSLSGGKTSLPTSVNFTADTNTSNLANWGGLY